jgi:tetrahydromethanopterin S-methyltransferase subunit F
MNPPRKEQSAEELQRIQEAEWKRNAAIARRHAFWTKVGSAIAGFIGCVMGLVLAVVIFYVLIRFVKWAWEH